MLSKQKYQSNNFLGKILDLSKNSPGMSFIESNCSRASLNASVSSNLSSHSLLTVSCRNKIWKHRTTFWPPICLPVCMCFKEGAKVYHNIWISSLCKNKYKIVYVNYLVRLKLFFTNHSNYWYKDYHYKLFSPPKSINGQCLNLGVESHEHCLAAILNLVCSSRSWEGYGMKKSNEQG